MRNCERKTRAGGDAELRTQRLRLRPLGLEHLEAIRPAVTDERVCRYMSWQPHGDRKETEQFLGRIERERRAGSAFTWAVYQGKTFCGLVALIAVTRTHRALRYDRAELAYWLRPEKQGRGLMTEAGGAVIAHAFDALGIRRLVVSHVPENEASRRVIERWGFRFVGRQREVFRKNGRWFDQCLYELLKADRRRGGAKARRKQVAGGAQA